MDKLFKALGDPTRLKIFEMILRDGEVCVCKIVDEMDVGQSAISHHIAILKNAGLISSRRDGQWIHYSVVPDVLADLEDYIKKLLNNINFSLSSDVGKACGR